MRTAFVAGLPCIMFAIIFMQHWSKLDHHEGEPCPVGRSHHAAVCIDYCGDHPQLLVTGGLGAGKKVLSDAWILDLQSGSWREVSSWIVLSCYLSI